MNKYLILQHPGTNSVYYSTSGKIALAELKIAIPKLKINCDNIEILEIANIRYLSFKTENKIMENELKIISRLSFIFALFEMIKISSSMIK